MREEERASLRAVMVWAYAKQLRVCGVRDEQWRRRETRGAGEVPSLALAQRLSFFERGQPLLFTLLFRGFSMFS